jgi:Kef-type K+ transport system membrane component KefB
MEKIFLDVTIVICIAAALSFVFKFLKQPLILAYILTGILIGPLALVDVAHEEMLHVMAQFGITLLLFMVGLDLKISDLKSVGKVSLITGTGQIIFTSLIGFLISLGFGFSIITSFYISIALTFSSTIIIVKLLSDKRDLHSLYGKISVGFLLVQDFFAILLLIFLSGFTSVNGESLSVWSFILTLIKGGILFGIVIFLSKNILPKIVDSIARSSEGLFLFSLAWAFGLASFVSSPLIGFSVEIGGFLAGLSLANSTENFQISSKIRPLRDFFITIFFVILGMNLAFGHIGAVLITSILLSLFVLIGNPVIVMIILGLMGYRKRTSFLAGLTVAQISEFSLIVIFLGSKIGHVSDEAVTLITVVGITTFVISTYMIVNGNRLYLLLSRFLVFFEKKGSKTEQLVHSVKDLSDIKNHVVLIGGDQMGKSILEALENMERDVIVVDFNPEIIKKIKSEKLFRLFGDISDLDIQEKAQIHRADLVISTVPDIEDNLVLLKTLHKQNKEAKVLVMAYDTHNAKILYKNGADYVILPHLAGGKQIAQILKENDFGKLDALREKDLPYL